jgi:hypothetical protein
MTIQLLKKLAPVLQQEDIIFHIHGFLSHKDTAKTSEVCRLWKKVANEPQIWINSNLEKVFSPNLSIIDEDVWQSHVDCPKLDLTAELSPEDKASSKINAIVVMRQFNAYLKVEENQGFTLLTISKGLSLNKLQEIAKSPMKGNAFDLHISDLSYLSKEFCEIAADKTYQFVITNNVLVGSKDRNIKPLVDHYIKCGLEIPKVLEVAALCTLTYIASSPPIHLLPRGGICTICSDKVADNVIYAGDFQTEKMDNIMNRKIPARFHMLPYGKNLSFVSEGIGVSIMKTIFL